jgi:hypothetical protein
MLNRLILPTLALLTLAPAASADKFYFGSAEEAAKTIGSPRMVQGVLVADDEDSYTIRIEGGVVTVPKSSVYKIERDGVTIEDIESVENRLRESLAAANDERIERQAAEREAREERLREIREAEEDAMIAAAQAYAPQLDGHGRDVSVYDPIIHVATDQPWFMQELIRQELGAFIRNQLRELHRKMQRKQLRIPMMW